MRRKPKQWSWSPQGALYARGSDHDAAVTVRTGDVEDDDLAPEVDNEPEEDDTPDVLEMMNGRER